MTFAKFSDGTSATNTKDYAFAWMCRWEYGGQVYRKTGFAVSHENANRGAEEKYKRLFYKPYQIQNFHYEIVPTTLTYMYA